MLPTHQSLRSHTRKPKENRGSMSHKPGLSPAAPPNKPMGPASRRTPTGAGAKRPGLSAPQIQSNTSADAPRTRVSATTPHPEQTAAEKLLNMRQLRTTHGENTRIPLPQVEIHVRPSSTLPLMSISVINDRGRVAAASTLALLKWHAHQPISFTVDGQLLVVTVSDTASKLRIDAHHHLYIPSELRSRLHIKSGDRILLVASEEHRNLVVYPPHALVTALFSQDPSVWLRL
ncbi:Uncharacterised protein [Nocardia africana]|uniref:SpoVT-AbrB domain-containing protein n=1 Tax=Nocardia africana TaxID=134964 RepID=A0A378X457_9NOCA|nr:Uncharacterised protein [Nocardia africana]